MRNPDNMPFGLEDLFPGEGHTRIVTEINTGGAVPGIEVKLDSNSVLVVPMKDFVAFPESTMPIAIDSESNSKTIEYAERQGEAILIVTQLDHDNPEPHNLTDLFKIGVIAKVMKTIELPDGSLTAFVMTTVPARIEAIKRKKPYLRASVSLLDEVVPPKDDAEMAALFVNVLETFHKILDTMDENAANEVRFALRQIENPLRLLSFVITASPITTDEKLRLLSVQDIKERSYMLAQMLDHSYQLIKLRADIQERTREELSQQQREHFLQQQLRSIQDELGSSEEKEITKLRARADEKKWDNEVRRVFDNELQKLERFNPTTPDYSIQFNYLEKMLSLPWNNVSEEQFTLAKVEKILNRDHYGLEKVKDRIVEHMAVLKLRGDMKSPILCLYGPPGVGKTSLGRSVADALGREYVRVSFGGLHDEAEIRGHRRTYIGAMPGRIIEALSKCKTNNPVFMLDEIDKIGKDFKGDPSTALLEVLDPEQNNKFHDNYLDVDYDLSKVLFIATANELDTISRPLLDRMEIIEISGYITEEKVEIAYRHLVPKALEAHGFQPKEVKFDKKALAFIIDRYTRESGVRQLDKQIAKVLRKIARLKASDKLFMDVVTKEMAKIYLGSPKVDPEEYENNDTTGVVTGLAWTSVGGEILFIESSLSKGKGELTLTGNLGNVMKESATLARQYVKAHAEQLDIDPEKFTQYDVHIHVPEGAVPKDGPSAGITIATSLASTFTGRKVREKLAMTGEITLRGKVLPVGGIKEKIIAARRAGITEIILSAKNRKDIEEIPAKYVKGLTFTYVDTISEVWDRALL